MNKFAESTTEVIYNNPADYARVIQQCLIAIGIYTGKYKLPYNKDEVIADLEQIKILAEINIQGIKGGLSRNQGETIPTDFPTGNSL